MGICARITLEYSEASPCHPLTAAALNMSWRVKAGGGKTPVIQSWRGSDHQVESNQVVLLKYCTSGALIEYFC